MLTQRLKTEFKRTRVAILAGALAIGGLPSLAADAGNCSCSEVACGCEMASCDCGEPVCGCEPVCGLEPTCGVDPGCGLEPGCGFEVTCGCEGPCECEVACGVEVGCGAEVGCGVDVSCGIEPACGCDVCSHAAKPNPFKKAFGSLKGGLNKIKHHLTKRSSSSCDDGCDAMMIEELSMAHSYTAPPASFGHSMNPVPQAPTMVPAPMPPRDRHSDRVGSGVVIPTPAVNHSHAAPSLPPSSMQMSQPSLVPTPMTDPGPAPVPRQETIRQDADDSLFDAVTDPFQDDEVSVRRRQAIQPTGYLSARETQMPKSSRRYR